MINDPNQFTHDAWDEQMGDEGNDFFNILCWPALIAFLDPQPGQHLLDSACGNGLTRRRLADPAQRYRRRSHEITL